MLAREVKWGGVLRLYNTANSHGKGLRDCFATTKLLSFTGQTFGQVQALKLVSATIMEDFRGVKYHHRLCYFASLCVSLLSNVRTTEGEKEGKLDLIAT